MKKAANIMHKVYKTSVVIPKVTLKKVFIFIFNEHITYESRNFGMSKLLR